MADTPDLNAWERAYALAERVKELAPWQWMSDTDHIAFRDSSDGETRFISVMGNAGEHYAIVVYTNAEALFSILDFLQDPGSRSDVILETAQLQLSFEDRDYLSREDRAILKQLGRRYRGRNAWPCFRSFVPGFFPWYVAPDELDLLCLAAEQVLEVAPRFEHDPAQLELLNRRGMERHEFLVRERVHRDAREGWEERLETVKRPPARFIAPRLDSVLMQRVAKGSPVENALEVDVFPLPEPCQDTAGQRPYFPYTVAVVEASEGFALACELLTPLPTLDAVYEKLPATVLKVLADQEVIPREIRVRTPQIAALLESACRQLDVDIKIQPTLPHVEELEASFRAFQGG